LRRRAFPKLRAPSAETAGAIAPASEVVSEVAGVAAAVAASVGDTYALPVAGVAVAVPDS
jgi:hypothetical protein